jgi:hypothetical protein
MINNFEDIGYEKAGPKPPSFSASAEFLVDAES